MKDFIFNDSSNIDFFKKNLCCPKCNNELKVDQMELKCEICGNIYYITNGIPNFFKKEDLSPHKKSELEFIEEYSKNHKNISYNSNSYKWALKWINSETVDSKSKVVCIGGSFLDDLPHIFTLNKFNVDHLANEYVKLLPEIKKAKTNYISASSEELPFPDNYADVVYARNSLDHVSNPIKTLLEINRILKPDGKFYLASYYDSPFIDSGETTSINEEFISAHPSVPR